MNLGGRLDHLKQADGRWALDIPGQALLQPGADDLRSGIGILLRCPQHVGTVLSIRVVSKERDGLATWPGLDGRDQVIGQVSAAACFPGPKLNRTSRTNMWLSFCRLSFLIGPALPKNPFSRVREHCRTP